MSTISLANTSRPAASTSDISPSKSASRANIAVVIDPSRFRRTSGPRWRSERRAIAVGDVEQRGDEHCHEGRRVRTCAIRLVFGQQREPRSLQCDHASLDDRFDQPVARAEVVLHGGIVSLTCRCRDVSQRDIDSALSDHSLGRGE
jgi:hypothetical protein